MDILSLWQFYWQALLKGLEFPQSILGIFTVIFLVIKIIPPKWENTWRNSVLKKTYQWIKPYSLHIFVILIIGMLLYAPYGLYKEKIEEVEQIYEEYRPVLTVVPKIIDVKVLKDDPRQWAEIKLDFIVNNIGDRGAYQCRWRSFGSPLTEPERIMPTEEIIVTNPIYMGAQNGVDYTYNGYYSKQGNTGKILIYTKIKYSSLPMEGKWYEEENWFSFEINFDSDESSVRTVSQKWIDLYRPYIDKLFPNEL